MTIVPFTQVASMLKVDAKTLRQWIKQANLLLQPSPTDARVKCLTDEQIHQLATVHGRCIDLDVALPSDQELVPSEMPTPLPFTSPTLASLDPVASPPSLQEAFITLQQQVTQLALDVGRLRDQMFEYRLSTFEAYHPQPVASSPRSEGAPALDHPPDDVPQTRWSPHPAEARAHSRVLPLIEYGACGTYVIVCPQEGVLSLMPDTPEWFVWLASLSSFRFTGKYGRFTAYRGGDRNHPSRSWCAYYYHHQRNHKMYIAITPNLTIDRLEFIAQQLHIRVQSL